MNNQINTLTCQNCNTCVLVCPNKIIKKSDAGVTVFDGERIHLCISCGQCMAVCKTKSIYIEGMSYEKDMISTYGRNMDFEAFYNLALSRRSIRNFKEKPVPVELLHKIIEIISFAPFGAIPDAVDITIISDRKTIGEGLPLMSGFYRKLGNWFKNPFMRMMIRVKSGAEQFNTIKYHLLDRINIGHYDTDSGQDNITRNAPVIMLFHGKPGTEMLTTDSIIYSTYTALAAHSLGLGATINSLVPAACNKSAELKRLFGIPQEHKVIESVLIGYQKIQYIHGIKHQKNKVHWN